MSPAVKSEADIFANLVHVEQYNKLGMCAVKLHRGLVEIFNERDKGFPALISFKDGFVPPDRITLRSIPEDEYERLKALKGVIDGVRAKIYG